MSNASASVPLDGSARPAPQHERIGEPDLTRISRVTLYLRGDDADPGRLSREAYATTYGASENDVAAVRTFALEQGLEVTDVDPARRSVELEGSLGSLASAFGADLGLYRDDAGDPYLAQEGGLRLPGDLVPIVSGVFGLDERTQAQPQFRPRPDATVQYAPPQVAAAYQFPTGLTGSGQCVGVIELGGGFRAADLTAYFSSLGINEPTIEAVGVSGASNTPGNANGPDGEVMLDVEVIGSVAPGATIVVYFAPNTDKGFLDAVTTAVHDTAHRPSVVSISWGSAESTWSAQAMQQMEKAFVAAAAMGVTVTVAAGDHGSSDGVTDGQAHVDFPASAPHALACGGTRLEIASGTIGSETVWNDGAGQGATGGGVSAVFPVPTYQQHAEVPPSVNQGAKPGRGVPDVCGDADPDTGYLVQVDGQRTTIGGTSAVAPLWAGLVALLNEGLGHPVGFLQTFLYATAGAHTTHDVVSGSNGAYSARTGWDACTGLGSPDGAALLAALRGASS